MHLEWPVFSDLTDIISIVSKTHVRDYSQLVLFTCISSIGLFQGTRNTQLHTNRWRSHAYRCLSNHLQLSGWLVKQMRFDEQRVCWDVFCSKLQILSRVCSKPLSARTSVEDTSIMNNRNIIVLLVIIKVIILSFISLGACMYAIPIML